MGFVSGEDRNQMTLFPEVLDDYVAEDNPVRFIDEFVGSLDLGELGFERAKANDIGRPAYDPADMLRLYIYGYLNRIRSSRMLEKESKRNLELMWLLKKLRPDHKTIARFRAENGPSLKQVWREFTLLCKQMELFGGELVAIDGSKFRAVNSKKHNYTREKLRALIKWADAKIDKYMKELSQGDEREAEREEPSAEDLKKKIKQVRERKQYYERQKETLNQSGESQVSTTDPDSRLMKTAQGMNVCYNVQIAVDSKHKLIVEQEVTNQPTDLTLLGEFAKATKEKLGVEQLEVVADRGYYSGSQVRECEQAGISAYIEKPPVTHKQGLFSKQQFAYNNERDVYVCPAGAELSYRCTDKKRRRKEYRATVCASCVIKVQCTTSKWGRAIKRTDEDELLERMALRVRGAPEKIGLRKTLVEHPFGTIKRGRSQGYFLVRGKRKVKGEMSLIALGYNLTRAINIIGVPALRRGLRGT